MNWWEMVLIGVAWLGSIAWVSGWSERTQPHQSKKKESSRSLFSPSTHVEVVSRPYNWEDLEGW